MTVASKNPLHKIPDGLLIAFEGIDGSGKTTMARRTSQALADAGYNAKYLREPTDGPHGRKLRQMMTTPGARDPQLEFELFLKDRREDVDQNIRPLLQAGGIACIDRYYISSIAYQGALGIDPQHIRRANEEFAPAPNLILYFDLPVELALERIASSRLDGPNNFEKEENLRRVAEIFQQLDDPQMVTINAAHDPEQVFQQIRQVLKPYVKHLP